MDNGKCPVSKRCGGCRYLDVRYEKQLKDKLGRVRELLKNYGNVETIIGMDNPYHYRNKINSAFAVRKKEGIVCGIYEEGTHNVIPMPENGCIIEDERAYPILSTIKRLISSFKIPIYNEDTGYGLLRHVMIRTGRKTGQIMVVLVTADPVFPSKKNFTGALLKEHKEITTIVQNINTKNTSMVLGDRNIVMYGKGYIEDVLCDKKFRISPNSFYQINPIQTQRLYEKAVELAGLTGKESVIDAYCGIGTIGMVASDKAKRVTGVELNKEAVRDAITNAKINNCNNITFYNNDAGKFMSRLAMQRKAGDNRSGDKTDVVFMDPPRSGSTKEFMDSLLTLAPHRIVYISCNPETLGRDLKYILQKGQYVVKKMIAVDMFCWTEHVESVVLLSKTQDKS